MPTYLIRPASNLYSYVEYQAALKKEVPYQTDQILSEVILKYETLAGVLSPGLVLTEAGSGAEGKLLWVKGSAARGEIGLGEVTAPFEGGAAVTGNGGVSFAGKAASNPIVRQSGDPIFANFSSLDRFNTEWTTAQETRFLDVRHTEKVFLTNLSTTGYIQACNQVSGNPLTLWVGPGRSAEIYCEQRIFRIVIVLSAAATPYSLAAIGEHSGLYKALAPRSLPGESKQVIDVGKVRARKK